jgi:hypothetical protein
VNKGAQRPSKKGKSIMPNNTKIIFECKKEIDRLRKISSAQLVLLNASSTLLIELKVKGLKENWPEDLISRIDRCILPF